MSETPKQNSTSLYDRIREEQHEKQRQEADRQRRVKELFLRTKDDLPDRFKGEK